MCTIDSAPRLALAFSVAMSTLQKEVMDSALVPEPFPGDAVEDTLPALPQVARALLNLSVFGAALSLCLHVCTRLHAMTWPYLPRYMYCQLVLVLEQAFCFLVLCC